MAQASADPRRPDNWPAAKLELDAVTGTSVLHGERVYVGNHPRVNGNKTVLVEVGNLAEGTAVVIQSNNCSVTLDGSRISLASRNASVIVDDSKIALKTTGTVSVECSAFKVKSPSVTFDPA